MENRNDILNELRELAPTLAGIEKGNPFKVPANYFEENQEVVLSVCADVEQVNINADEAFAIPEGYFNTLSERILVQVKEGADATVELSETLERLKAEQVFTTPVAYFDELPERVLAKVKAEGGARVVPMNTDTPAQAEPEPGKTKVVPLYRRVASLAAVVLLFFVGAYVVSNLLPGNQASFGDQLAELSDQDLNSMIVSNIDDIDDSMLLDYSDDYNIFDFIEINPELLDEYLLEELDESLIIELL